jgi:mannose-6-phosphate isomerase-like protein (cupin superfamily)
MKLLALLAVVPLFAADQPGFVVWKDAELKNYEKKLHGKLDQYHSSNERLPDFEGHQVLIVHREGTGQAELHENQADMIYIMSGEASVVVGGTMVEGKSTAPKEIRGASINGGETKKVSAGDMLHIPPNVPHIFKLDAGKQVTYFVVKLDAK